MPDTRMYLCPDVATVAAWQIHLEAGFGRLPRPLHRIALRAAHALRTAWWRIRRPAVSGVRIVAVDRSGRILLIRQSYGWDGWRYPGGGIKPGEAVIEAARRELREETGCELVDGHEVDRTIEPLFGASNDVHTIAGMVVEEPRADRREVSVAAFFDVADLPGYLRDNPWFARTCGRGSGVPLAA